MPAKQLYQFGTEGSNPSLSEKLNMNFPYKKITYFPFIGWLFPYLFDYENENSLFHAKQGLVLAAIFGGLSIFVFLSSEK